MSKLFAGPGIDILTGYMPTLTATGVVRWNGTLQHLEVMTNNGNSYDTQWIPLPEEELSITLAVTHEEALHWAMKKMNEENRIQKLLNQHPGLKDLKEKYEVMLALGPK